jgi:hypothetical protein
VASIDYQSVSYITTGLIEPARGITAATILDEEPKKTQQEKSTAFENWQCRGESRPKDAAAKIIYERDVPIPECDAHPLSAFGNLEHRFRDVFAARVTQADIERIESHTVPLDPASFDRPDPPFVAGLGRLSPFRFFH